MRERGFATNGMLRQLGLVRHDATAALADLVSRRLALRLGGRRYARYVLLDDPDRPTMFPVATAADRTPNRRDRTAAIDRLFDPGRPLRKTEVMATTGLGAAMVTRYLNRLIDAGRIAPTAGPQAKDRAYRRVGH